MIKIGNRQLIDPSTIAYIISFGNIAKVYCTDQTTLLSAYSLKHLEQSLNAPHFIKPSRYCLVNKNFVDKVFLRRRKLVLKDSTEVVVSRRRLSYVEKSFIG